MPPRENSTTLAGAWELIKSRYGVLALKGQTRQYGSHGENCLYERGWSTRSGITSLPWRRIARAEAPLQAGRHDEEGAYVLFWVWSYHYLLHIGT